MRERHPEDDCSAVSQLILRERQGRDRGWWEQMRGCYLEESVVRVSWFAGTGDQFVEESIAMVARGNLSVHRMSPPVVQVNGRRALAEVAAAIEVRARIDGVEADLVSFTRLLVRAERGDSGWLIRRLEGIYERDSLTASVPGSLLPVEASDFVGFRPSYRCLSFVLGRLGYRVDPDLPGDDRPEVTAAMYQDGWRWLQAEGVPLPQ